MPIKNGLVNYFIAWKRTKLSLSVSKRLLHYLSFMSTYFFQIYIIILSYRILLVNIIKQGFFTTVK